MTFGSPAAAISAARPSGALGGRVVGCQPQQHHIDGSDALSPDQLEAVRRLHPSPLVDVAEDDVDARYSSGRSGSRRVGSKGCGCGPRAPRHPSVRRRLRRLQEGLRLRLPAAVGA